MGAPSHDQGRHDQGRRDQQWLLMLFPALPVALLTLRLWYLSRQDLQTMLLLIQHVNPLGLVSAMTVTLLWFFPLVVLTGRAFGALVDVSAAEDGGHPPSWLGAAGERMPAWVVTLAAAGAAITWQLRFLPSLAALVIMIIGLRVRLRHPGRRTLVLMSGVALPLVAAAAIIAWVAPAAVDALAAGERLTAGLLVVPPALAVFLTGPLPHRPARLLTEGPATLAVLTPFFLAAVFIRAPILPLVAMETDPPGQCGSPAPVLRGHVIATDDRMTTLLDHTGRICFILNDRLASKTLCPSPDEVPTSAVDVHGWHVEDTVLERGSDPTSPPPLDRRCFGRPLTPPEEPRPREPG